MKKLSLIAILTSIMIMASSAFCFADGGFDLVSSYPEDGQTNTSMENLGVKLTFSKPLSSAEAQKANADKLAIYDEDGRRIPAASHPRQQIAIPAEQPPPMELPLICRRPAR